MDGSEPQPGAVLTHSSLLNSPAPANARGFDKLNHRRDAHHRRTLRHRAWRELLSGDNGCRTPPALCLWTAANLNSARALPLIAAEVPSASGRLWFRQAQPSNGAQAPSLE